MERYDGKTKRDDYIKYGLIAAGVIMVLAIIFTANHLVRKRYHKEPDYKVVLVSEEADPQGNLTQMLNLPLLSKGRFVSWVQDSVQRRICLAHWTPAFPSVMIPWAELNDSADLR